MKTITKTWMLVFAVCLPTPTMAAGRGKTPLNWGLCPTESGIEARPSSEGLEPGFGAVEGDQATLVKNGVSTFSGNAELVRDNNAVRADKLTYDKPGQIVDALGHARLWSGSIFWEGEHANLDMDKEEGVLDEGKYRLTDTHGRGSAKHIEHNSRRNVTKMREVTYTTCPSGDTPNWEIDASKMFLNHNAERGSARNAVIRIKGIPIAYTPYISFPLTNARKSGLLPPTLRSAGSAGFDTKIPFYWNIAPNYDATITPRYLTARGVMLGGEARYLKEHFKGILAADYMPEDRLLSNSDRWIVQFQHDQLFDSNRGHLVINFNNVSDKRYLEDFGETLAITSTSFLDRYANLTYGRDWWSVYARVNSFQTVDETIPATSRPYDDLPQIFYYTGFAPLFPHVNAQIYGETTYFDRADSVTGGRFNLKPFVSFPFENAAGFFTPKISLDQTWYSLNNNSLGSDRIARTVPTFSVDSGLYFEREMALGKQQYLHTLEPRIFYLYRPKVQQDDIPVFDSSQYDFSFSQLFRDNRYSSIDRLGDANSITFALTSRLLGASTGRERLRGSIGEIYHFADRKVVLPGQSTFTDTTSEIVAEAFAQVNDSWSLGGTIEWDPNHDLTDRSSVRVRYRPGENKLFNFDYRFSRSVSVDQTDMSFRWPLKPGLALLGRWSYSLPETKTLEAVGGIEYESCCWGVRLVGRRFIRTSQGSYDNAIMLEFELKGLGGLGRGTTTYLKRNVPGYTNEF
jgi:LPS-assembly protein